MVATDTLVYSDLQQQAIDAWGFPSGTTDERTILEAWSQHPTAVARAFQHVLERHKAGKVRQPWRVWAMECSSAQTASVSVPAHDRGRDIDRVLGWIGRAGCYWPTEAELVDTVFGHGGQLEYLAGDPVVVAQVVGAWREANPAALGLEAEALERAAVWRRQMDVQGRFIAVQGEAGREARARLQRLTAEVAA